jgi:hypothetical protein
MIGAVAAGIGLIVSCAITARIPDLVQSPRVFLSLVVVSFACYAAGIWCLTNLHGPRPMFVIVVIAVAARLLLVPASPTLSTDVYRYVWDARVARRNQSLLCPPGVQSGSLRDTEVFQAEPSHVAHHLSTRRPRSFCRLSPPARQRARDEGALGFAELIGLAAVFGLLRASDRPVSQLVIYAWNPLVLSRCGVWGIWTGSSSVVAGAAWAAFRAQYARGSTAGPGRPGQTLPGRALPLLPMGCGPRLVGLPGSGGPGLSASLIAGTPVVGLPPMLRKSTSTWASCARTGVPALTLAVAASG